MKKEIARTNEILSNANKPMFKNSKFSMKIL